MVNLVALTFHVEHQWSCLSLDIANQVVVVVELILWLEQDLHRDLRLGGHHSRDGVHSQRVSVVWTSLDALFRETEAEGNVLLVDQLHSFSVFTLEQQGTEFDLACFEEHVGLVDAADHEEMLDDVFSWDPEYPYRLMLSDAIGCILKHHLGLFATQDEAFLGEALKHRFVFS